MRFCVWERAVETGGGGRCSLNLRTTMYFDIGDVETNDQCAPSATKHQVRIPRLPDFLFVTEERDRTVQVTMPISAHHVDQLLGWSLEFALASSQTRLLLWATSTIGTDSFAASIQPCNVSKTLWMWTIFETPFRNTHLMLTASRYFLTWVYGMTQPLPVTLENGDCSIDPFCIGCVLKRIEST